jgi:hypothetical protein
VKRESDLVKIVRDDLNALKNCWFFKTQEVARRGVPDFIICLRGNFFALELKRDDRQGVNFEEKYPLQDFVLKEIIKAGGLAYVITPGNWDFIYSALVEIDRA